MKHSFTRALTARKVDFMMIITGERSKSGWPRAFHAGFKLGLYFARGASFLNTHIHVPRTSREERKRGVPQLAFTLPVTQVAHAGWK